MAETFDTTQYFKVKYNGRIVRLAKHLGDDRYLCTDDLEGCHPCYNLRDLEPFANGRDV